MKNNKRLSLEDFKVKKNESKNEIDKMLGGAAAACHVTQCPPPIKGDWNDPICN
jgi:hypothetical protein